MIVRVVMQRSTRLGLGHGMEGKFRATIATYFLEHYLALLAFVRSLVADTAARDGEDMVQDVALSILNRAEVAVPIENLPAYVYRALRNRVIDEMRRPSGGVLSLEADAAPGSDLRLSDVLADLRPDPASSVEREETRQSLYQAIDALPLEQKAVIIATEIQGHSYRELAEAWGVPMGTLLARKARGLKTMRARLALALGKQEV